MVILNTHTVGILNGAVHSFCPLVQEAGLLVSPDVGLVGFGDDPDKDEEEAEGESGAEDDAIGEVIDTSGQLVDDALLGLDRDIWSKSGSLEDATIYRGEVRSR